MAREFREIIRQKLIKQKFVFFIEKFQAINDEEFARII